MKPPAEHENAAAPTDAPPAALVEEVDGLIRRGEHARAAALLREAGFPGRAAPIFERIFERAAAIEAYEEAGDVVAAVRVAIDIGDAARLEGIVTSAVARGQGELLLAALGRGGRDLEVARVHAARGDLEAAAASFERAGALDRAAQCLEEAGRARDAGVLYERRLDEHPEDAESAWRLGRIVARFGRHDDGVALLQRAVRGADDVDVMLARVAPALMVSFVQLGYEHAARSVLARWKAAAARLARRAGGMGADAAMAPPDTFEAFLGSDRGAAHAAIQSTSESTGDDDGGLLLAGRYLLGEPLGGGGVGQVFRANASYDAFADRPVAVKIFGAQALASDAIKELAREVRAFATLRHPAVASLVELNMAHGFVVTELVRDGTLEERLRAGGDAGWLVAAARALLDLLASAHRVGLVHGGLKPTSVFLVPGGVRVVDVGAHRLLALRSTETGGLASVWPYLAPEQLFGAPSSTSADLYAVAAMLFRAFTGRPPFARVEDDRRRAPPTASSVHPGVPSAWDAFFARALHPDASQRFQDAGDMADSLPRVPPEHVLPPARTPEGAASHDAARVAAHGARYVREALVHREADGAVRFHAGTDVALGRPVWLVDADDAALLRPLMACARPGGGIQPVYDVLPSEARVVVARDPVERGVDLAALRAVPQGLARDLAGVARALDALHDAGWCVGGFPPSRALGPVGPRLTIAPAPLFLASTAEGVAADWRGFDALVQVAFDLEEHEGVDVRTRMLAALSDRRVLERSDIEALTQEAAHARWSSFLDAIVQRLVAGAQARVVARLVAQVLRG